MTPEAPPAMAGPGPELVYVEMSDGARLACHLYRVPGVQKAPVVLMVIPYRKEGALAAMLAGAVTGWGFHYLVADVRGIGGSVAPYEGLWSEREITDGVELIEWAAAQDFCDGGVGAFGASYCGGNQLLFAARRPRGLRCIAPIVGVVDTYRDWTHRGGIPSHTSWGAMTYLRSQQPDTARRGIEQYYLDFCMHPFDDDAHRARSPEDKLRDIEVPTLAIGGWHDYFLRGTVRTYLGVSGPKRIVVGPWGHGDHQPGPELERWYRYWLRGEGTDPTEGDRVRLYVTGADTWRELTDWPSVDTRRWRRWHPAPEGRELAVRTHLMAVMPATNPRPQFVPDPTDSGMSLWGEDVTFDTQPFEEPTLLEGPVGFTAVLKVDGAADGDLHARLSVVSHDGAARQLTEGRLRLSHRAVDRERSVLSPQGEIVIPWHPHTGDQPLSGDVEAHVEIHPICHRFDAGERLRLGVTLVRADAEAVPARAMLMPQTRLLLPVAP